MFVMIKALSNLRSDIFCRATGMYATKFSINRRTPLRLLDVLSRNGCLREQCSRILVDKVNGREIGMEAFFRFDVGMICTASHEAQIGPVVGIAKDIEKGRPLSLGSWKKCQFEPLFSGEVRLLLMYYSLSDPARMPFLKGMAGWHKDSCTTIYERLNSQFGTELAFSGVKQISCLAGVTKPDQVLMCKLVSKGYWV